MKVITKLEAALVAEIGALKARYQTSPSPAIRSEIAEKSKALHAEHARAEAAIAAVIDGAAVDGVAEVTT